MSVLLDAAAFVAGVHIGMRMLAAALRLRDLWYAIGREYPRVVRGMLGWGGAGAIAFWLAGSHRPALCWGLLVQLLLYVVVHGLSGVGVRAMLPPK